MGQVYSCVASGNVAIVERCGRFNRVGHPGFNCVLCCIGDSIAGKVSLRIQQLPVACETKTKDNVFVNVVVSVQYQVLPHKIEESFYKLTNQNDQIRAYVFDVVRSTVPQMNLDDVFIAKEEIAAEVREQLAKSMETFGFAIIQTLVTDIMPAATVKAAMNEINASKRMRLASLQRAEADKIAVVKAAEADAEAKFLAGQGIARQRQAIVAGLRESVKKFSHSVDDIGSREVMEMMLITQYFDTLKDIGANNKSSTVFVPHQPGATGDVGKQIRGGFMQSAAAQRMSKA